MTEQQTNTIEICSEQLTIQAADAGSKKLPTFDALAYTGGLIFVAGHRRGMVIDLAGLEIEKPSIPILAGHDEKSPVGHAQVYIRGGRLLAEGTFSIVSKKSSEIVDGGKNGFPWQASIGAEIIAQRYVPDGEKITANDQLITAPEGGMTLVIQSRLKEISLLPLGADSKTEVQIHAKKGDSPMTTATKTEEKTEIRAGLIQQMKTIRATCKSTGEALGLDGDAIDAVESQAIEAGWDEPQIKAAMLDRAEQAGKLADLRASRASVPAIHTGREPADIDTIQAGYALKYGSAAQAEKDFGPKACERASRQPFHHAMDIVKACCRLDHIDTGGMGRSEIVRAASSGASLPQLLGDSANKSLLRGYNETPATWRPFVNVRSVANFHEATATRFDTGDNFNRVAPDGELKHGVLTEDTLTYQVETFGKIIGVDRKMIINDNLGAFNDVNYGLGKRGRRTLNDKVYEILLEAGIHFHADNGNLLTGAATNLNMGSLGLAISSMRRQRDAAGNDLDLAPAVLVVPPEIEATARAILHSQDVQIVNNVDDADSIQPSGNSLKDAVTLEVEPRLSNDVKYGSNASDTAWYLFASPADVPMVVAFLEGQQNPVVESLGMQATPDKLAFQWRAYFDFGVAMGDFRAAVKSNGE